MQRYTIVFITINALHVSGGSSAHHQELKFYKQHRVFVELFLLLTAMVSELKQVCVCCSNSTRKLVSTHSPKLDKYQMLFIQFVLLMMGGGTA